MKSHDKWVIPVCLLLAVALIFAAFALLGKVADPEKDSFWDKIFIFDDDSDETSEDTTTSAEDISPSETTGSGSLEEYTPHTLTFNLGETESDIKLGYVQNTNQEIFAVGICTTALKANTSYRVSWTIDEAIFTDTQLYIPTKDFDGTEKYYLEYSTNYIEGDDVETNFRYLASSSYSAVVDGYYDFNSAASGSQFMLTFFEYANPGNSISFNDFPSYLPAIKPYITVTITELVG